VEDGAGRGHHELPEDGGCQLLYGLNVEEERRKIIKEVVRPEEDGECRYVLKERRKEEKKEAKTG
jgi:hypothetical protein